MPKYKEEQESRYISRTVAIYQSYRNFVLYFMIKIKLHFYPKHNMII